MTGTSPWSLVPCNAHEQHCRRQRVKASLSYVLKQETIGLGLRRNQSGWFPNERIMGA